MPSEEAAQNIQQSSPAWSVVELNRVARLFGLLSQINERIKKEKGNEERLQATQG